MNRLPSFALSAWSPGVFLSLWVVLGLASPALAWKPITHVYLAEEAREELMSRGGSLTVNEVDFFERKILGSLGTFAVSSKVYDALSLHPEYYRAGALGPDAYPDMLFGQQTLHPETNREGGTDAWLQLMASQVETPAQRAFYLGFLSHAAGDMFGHTLVNHYAGGPFTLTSLDNARRHMVVEGYLGERTPELRSASSYTIETSQVDDFIYKTLIDGRRPPNGELSNLNLPADQLTRTRIWSLTRETFQSSLPGLFTRLRAALEDLLAGHSDQKQALVQLIASNLRRCGIKNPVACTQALYGRVLLGNYMKVKGIALPYLELWRRHIDEGLRAWPATNTEIARALFMRKDRRMDLGAAEQALLQYRDRHLGLMLGRPYITSSVATTCAAIIQGATGRLAFLHELEERPFAVIIKGATGHAAENWKALAEANAAAVDQHLPATPSTSAQLNTLMHVGGKRSKFELNRFAAAYNTTLATKLSMLDTREQWRSVLGSAGWLPPDPLGMMTEHSFHGQILHGFIRSLDADNQWSSPARMYLAEDCGLFSRFFMQQTGDYWESPSQRSDMEAQCPELVSLSLGESQPQCGGVDLQVELSQPTGRMGGVLKLEGHLASGEAIAGTPNHVWIAPSTTLASVRFATGFPGASTGLTATGTRVEQRRRSVSATSGCAANQSCSKFQCVLPPLIMSTVQSALTVHPRDTVTFRATAMDPQQSALTFTWTASEGGLVVQTDGASESEFVWRASSCAPVGTNSSITLTVRNAYDLTDSTTLFVLNGFGGVRTACWSSAGSMGVPRRFHTATLLPSGKVLVAGGEGGSAALKSAELYDPASGTWSPTGSMAGPRRFHTATLLPSGEVLVVGGRGAGTQVLSTAELYDPASGTWSPTRSMAAPRSFHTATLLPSGKVLVSGGGGLGAELYDPAAGTWSPTGSMISYRSFHTATLLPSGKVLVTGGMGGDFEMLNTAELYDPASGTWSPTGRMRAARYNQTATPLSSGKVLVAGGVASDGSITPSAELYDPATETWSLTGSMSSSRTEHTATLLPSGKVLVTGGTAPDSLATTELYEPTSGRWLPLGSMANSRHAHAATLLRSGAVVVTGGLGSAAEVYSP